MKRKVITAAEAVSHIPDGAFIAFSGVGGHGIPMEILHAVSARFDGEAHPRGISVIHSGGNSHAQLLAKEGMIDAYYSGLPSLDEEVMRQNRFPVYSLTQGICLHLYRAQANDTPYLTKVGLNTYLDPRIEAAAANAKAAEKPMVELVSVSGQEYLHFMLPPITVAIIRGTTADTDGNIVTDDESVKHEILYLAMAAHNNGGIVIAQVKHIAPVGSLPGAAVKVPGLMVDYVVPCSDQAKWHAPVFDMPYGPGLSGCHKADDSVIPLESYAPAGERLIAARRAAAELCPGCVCNVGIGMPVGLAYIASKEGVQDMFYLSNELGAIGGHIGGGRFFSAAFNARAYLQHHEMFDFINGHGLDITFLGAAEIGEDGSVNVTRIGGRIKGSGGFVNISASTPKIVFLSSFTIGGKSVFENGVLKILAPGKGGKFLKKVDQLSFNGPDAVVRGQEILYITERAVFRLTGGKVTLTEYAPGLDVDRDILAFMDFRPDFCFGTGLIGLKEQWDKQ